MPVRAETRPHNAEECEYVEAVASGGGVLRIQEAYSQYEMANEGNKSRSGVLVSVDSIEDLKAAYPSYYGSTYRFLLTVKAALFAQSAENF
jgi:hypothetical protein